MGIIAIQKIFQYLIAHFFERHFLEGQANLCANIPTSLNIVKRFIILHKTQIC